MIQNFYTETMAVYAENTTRGVTGGMIIGGTAKASDQACRVQDGASALAMFAGAKDMRTTHTIFTSYASTANGDYVVVASSTYKVHGINKRRGIGGIDDFYVLTVEEIH